MKINVNGTWKDGTTWINVGGTWKQGVMWTNVSGVWKKENTPSTYVTSGLILYFNAYGITTGTTWNDLSGNNHTATLTGFNNTTSSGWNGNSLVFDGTNDIVKIPSYIPMTTDSDFTLELYMQTSTPTTQMRLVSFGSSTRFYFEVNSTSIKIGLGGNSVSFTNVSSLPSANTKTHYILTRSGTTINLWKNGTKVGTTTLALQGSIALGAGYIIGGSYEGDGYLDLNGKIYINRWYSRALIDTEITQNYNQAISGESGTPSGSATIVSINSISNINVANGTTKSNIGLPSTVTVTMSDSTQQQVAVTWDSGTPTYNSTTAGTYTFSGTVTGTSLKTSVNVIVASASSGGGGATSGLQSINNFKIYYGNPTSSIITSMQSYGMVDIEVQYGGYSSTQINTLKSAGVVVLGYISIIELATYHPIYSLVTESDYLHDSSGNRIPDAGGWGNYILDLSSSHLRQLFVNSIGTDILARGCNGIFMDTIDDMEYMVDMKTQTNMDKVRTGYETLLQQIRQAYPNIIMVQNRGFTTFKNFGYKYVEGILYEDFPTSGDSTNINELKNLKSQYGSVLLASSFSSSPSTYAQQNGFIFSSYPSGSYATW